MKKLGLDESQQDNQDAVQEIIGNALTAGGMKIDQDKLWRKLAGLPQEQGDAAVGQIFERQRQSTNAALLSGYRRDAKGNILVDQLIGQSRRGGEGLDAALELHLVSAETAAKRLGSAWEQLGFKLAKTPAIHSAIGMLNSLVDKFNSLSPAMQNAAMGFAIVGALAAPAVMVAGALTTLGVAAGGALLTLGRFVALPFIAAAAGLARFGAIAMGFGAIKMGALALGLAPIATFIGVVLGGAAVVGILWGLYEVITNYDKLQASAGFSNMSASFADLQTSATGLTNSMRELMGMKPTSTPFIDFLTEAMNKVSGLFDALTLLFDLLQGKKFTLDRLQNALSGLAPFSPVAKLASHVVGLPTNGRTSFDRGALAGEKLGTLAEQDISRASRDMFRVPNVGLSTVPQAGLPKLDLTDLRAASGPFERSGSVMERAGQMMLDAASRMLSMPSPSAPSPGTKGGAVSPAPTEANSQAYGRK